MPRLGQDVVIAGIGETPVGRLPRMSSVEIQAAAEKLFEVKARDTLHLIELAWHLGNRHLSAQIEEDRILILRDHVIRSMLQGLGATVYDIEEPFQPARGAYHAHGGHSHGHDQHGHDHHGHDHHDH